MSLSGPSPLEGEGSRVRGIFPWKSEISPARGEGRKSVIPGLPRKGKITDDGGPHGSRHRHQTVSNGECFRSLALEGEGYRVRGIFPWK